MEIVFKSKQKREHYLWVEKYRPVSLDTYLGNDLVKETFKTYIAQNDIPQLFLYGTAGTGKTTLAKILTKSIECDSLYINSSDERGIDAIRDKTKSFASSAGFKPLKILILDEADGITPAGQECLRSIMEVYSLHTRFILTGNYQERLIEPIMSRVQSFNIVPPIKKEVALHLVNILNKEGVTYTNEDLAGIINAYYPDIRKVIQVAQQSTLEGVLKWNKNIGSYDIKTKLLEILKNRGSLLQARQFIMDSGITKFGDIYEFLHERLMDFTPEENVGLITYIIRDHSRDDRITDNKQIMFVACMYEILKALKKI